jgi:predicted membrane chloride channel (bestrophin family)
MGTSSTTYFTTFRSVFINNSVFNLHFMKVSTEIDNNFGYEKITQLVDNIPLSKVRNRQFEYYNCQIQDMDIHRRRFITYRRMSE